MSDKQLKLACIVWVENNEGNGDLYRAIKQLRGVEKIDVVMTDEIVIRDFDAPHPLDDNYTRRVKASDLVIGDILADGTRVSYVEISDDGSKTHLKFNNSVITNTVDSDVSVFFVRTQTREDRP